MSAMKSVDDHLADVLTGLHPLQPLEMQLLDAEGCVLAEDVLAPWDLPRHPIAQSAGYAVRSADVSAATDTHPIALPVVGDVEPGMAPTITVQPGMSARLPAGAVVPDGADAVVPTDWTDGGISGVTIRRSPLPNSGLRAAGSDVRRGEIVLATGTRLRPAQLGILAAIGRARAVVRPRPRVVVISTGSGLIEPGEEPTPGQTSEANSYALTASARQAGALAFRVGIVAHDTRRVLDTMEDQLIRADLVVVTGGVEDERDVVPQVLNRLGTASMSLLAMEPGGLQGFGSIGPDATPVFALPGDPVGAYVSFEVFVRPVIRRMLGAGSLHRPVLGAIAQETIHSVPGRREFVHGVLDVADGHYVVRAADHGDPHLLGGLAQANCFIVVGEDTDRVTAGDPVAVMVLERRLG
jgi:molybdopterin molybdotransferase